MAKLRARTAFALVVLYFSRKLAVLVPGRSERWRQTRKYLGAGVMASKLLWFETEDIRKDLVSKPRKSGTLKIKQSFKSGFTFTCFGLGIVFAAQCICCFAFLFEIHLLVSLVCDDSASCYCFRTGNESAPFCL